MDEDVTGTGSRQTLQGIAEIRHFFRTNETPIYFVGATPFNLLGIDRWVRNFRYVTYYDAWDGEHPHVITPRDKPYIEFSSGEEINNYCCCIPRCAHGWRSRSAQGRDGLLRRGDRTDLRRARL